MTAQAQYVLAMVVSTKQGPRIRVTTPDHKLIGYYSTVAEMLDDIDVPVQVAEGVYDYSHVVPPVLARAHHYE